MDRRTFIGSAAGGLLALPFATLAQGVARIRIGWLLIEAIPSNLATFRQALKELGYVEGENLVRRKVDIIVTTGTVASREAQKATATIPIVFVTNDPVASGLVASLSRPGGNLTGLENMSGDFEAKRIQLLKDIIPSLVNLA